METIEYTRTESVGDVCLCGGVTNPINRLFLHELSEVLEEAAALSEVGGLGQDSAVDLPQRFLQLSRIRHSAAPLMEPPCA